MSNDDRCPLCGHAVIYRALFRLECDGPETCQNSDTVARLKRELAEQPEQPGDGWFGPWFMP